MPQSWRRRHCGNDDDHYDDNDGDNDDIDDDYDDNDRTAACLSLGEGDTVVKLYIIDENDHKEEK